MKPATFGPPRTFPILTVVCSTAASALRVTIAGAAIMAAERTTKLRRVIIRTPRFVEIRKQDRNEVLPARQRNSADAKKIDGNLTARRYPFEAHWWRSPPGCEQADRPVFNSAVARRPLLALSPPATPQPI